ncbi:type 4a pilus biogenesis protein PilO [bacterium]|nr:type 4a pilus biogenesis protein PilO [bacterium]
MQKFQELPPSARMGIIAGASVIFLLILFFVIYWPLLKEISSLKKQILDQKNETVDARERLSHLTEKKERLEQLKKESEILKLRVPVASAMPTLLDQLTKCGRKSDMNLLPFEVSPKEKAQMGSDVVYFKIPILINGLKCRYRDLYSFLKQISNLERLINIKYLKMERYAYEPSTGQSDIPGISIIMLLNSYQLHEIKSEASEERGVRRSR